MLESEPLVAIHFSFGGHANEDVPLLGAVKKQALGFFRPNTRNIFWEEAANQSRSAQREEIEFRTQGESEISFLGEYLQVYLGGAWIESTSEQREINKQKILDGERIPILQGLTLSEFQSIVFYTNLRKIMDEIVSDGLRLEQTSEVYRDITAQRLSRLIDAQKVKEKESQHVLFTTGNVFRASKPFEQATRTLAEICRIRDPKIAAGEKNLVEEAYRKNQPTRQFHRLGETHGLSVINYTKELLPPDVPVTSTYDFGEPMFFPTDRLVIALIQNPTARIEQEEWVKAMFGGLFEGLFRLRRMPRPQRYALINRVSENSSIQELSDIAKQLVKLGLVSKGRLLIEFAGSKAT